jgi:hypothetical protein
MQKHPGGPLRSTLLHAVVVIGLGCGAEPTSPAGNTDTGTGGNKGTGGTAAVHGSGGLATGGTPSNGGALGAGGLSTGGTAGASSPGTGGASVGSGGTSGPRQDAGNTPDSWAGQGGASGTGGTIGSGGTITADASVGPDATAPDLPPIPDAPAHLDTPPTFWTKAYTANCTPSAIGSRAQTDGHHRAGEDCMRSGCHLNPKNAHHHAGTDCRGSGCHANGSPDGSGAPAFLFGGTVYRAVTLTADPAVEVGVKTASATYATCSASNGNFWQVAPSGTTTLSWTGTAVRLRNGNGEAAMMTTSAAGCNATTCHTGTLKMTSP